MLNVEIPEGEERVETFSISLHILRLSTSKNPKQKRTTLRYIIGNILKVKDLGNLESNILKEGIGRVKKEIQIYSVYMPHTLNSKIQIVVP